MEASNIMDYLGNRPIVDYFNFAGVNSDAVSVYNISKEYDLIREERAPNWRRASVLEEPLALVVYGLSALLCFCCRSGCHQNKPQQTFH